MAIGLYMDVHIPRAITNGWRLRGINVLTAQEDQNETLPDSDLLDRASDLGRARFSQDDDLLSEAHRRLSINQSFAGVIYSHQLSSPIGRCNEDLELIAKICDPEDMLNRIEFIPF